MTGSVRFHELIPFEYPLFADSALPTLRAANTIAGIIEKFSIEVVNAHYAIPHATSALLARDSGLPVKVVTTIHGTDALQVGQDPAFRYTTRHALQSSDAVTAVSHFLATEATAAFSLSRPITVIPNWVDSARFVRITEPSLRARYAQPDELLCLHVSNFRTVKRPIDAVQVFSRILAQTPARLILVGEGPEKHRSIEEAMRLGVSGRVLSIPPVAAIEEYMGIADVLLLPSAVEGSGLVLLEAMAAGALCIASDVGGIREVITTGETGHLCPVGEVHAMADVALRTLRDPLALQLIRTRARSTIIERFSPESAVSRYEDVLTTLLPQRNASPNQTPERA